MNTRADTVNKGSEFIKRKVDKAGGKILSIEWREDTQINFIQFWFELDGDKKRLQLTHSGKAA